uniref:Uncharacterized protein n=1 Tax=Glossina morsitans morsitans TaxID=37546 RepID=A0A1B0GC10_GLOMM
MFKCIALHCNLFKKKDYKSRNKQDNNFCLQVHTFLLILAFTFQLFHSKFRNNHVAAAPSWVSVASSGKIIEKLFAYN